VHERSTEPSTRRWTRGRGRCGSLRSRRGRSSRHAGATRRRRTRPTRRTGHVERDGRDRVDRRDAADGCTRRRGDDGRRDGWDDEPLDEWTSFPLATTFVWDGTSNILVETSFELTVDAVTNGSVAGRKTDRATVDAVTNGSVAGRKTDRAGALARYYSHNAAANYPFTRGSGAAL